MSMRRQCDEMFPMNALMLWMSMKSWSDHQMVEWMKYWLKLLFAQNYFFFLSFHVFQFNIFFVHTPLATRILFMYIFFRWRCYLSFFSATIIMLNNTMGWPPNDIKKNRKSPFIDDIVFRQCANSPFFIAILRDC